MGAKLFKETFPTLNHNKENKCSIPMEKEQIELLSHKYLDSEFNKLYLNSREKLHNITENASEEMLNNIHQYLKQNSKFLENCFNEVNTYQYEIVDMVTERLTYEEGDYKVPSTESKHVDSYLSSSCEKQQQSQRQ